MYTKHGPIRTWIRVWVRTSAGLMPNVGPSEHGSLSHFGTVLTDVEEFIKRSMGDGVTEGSLELVLDCEPSVMTLTHIKDIVTLVCFY